MSISPNAGYVALSNHFVRKAQYRLTKRQNDLLLLALSKLPKKPFENPTVYNRTVVLTDLDLALITDNTQLARKTIKDVYPVLLQSRYELDNELSPFLESSPYDPQDPNYITQIFEDNPHLTGYPLLTLTFSQAFFKHANNLDGNFVTCDTLELLSLTHIHSSRLLLLTLADLFLTKHKPSNATTLPYESLRLLLSDPCDKPRLNSTYAIDLVLNDFIGDLDNTSYRLKINLQGKAQHKICHFFLLAQQGVARLLTKFLQLPQYLFNIISTQADKTKKSLARLRNAFVQSLKTDIIEPRLKLQQSQKDTQKLNNKQQDNKNCGIISYCGYNFYPSKDSTMSFHLKIGTVPPMKSSRAVTNKRNADRHTNLLEQASSSYAMAMATGRLKGRLPYSQMRKLPPPIEIEFDNASDDIGTDSDNGLSVATKAHQPTYPDADFKVERFTQSQHNLAKSLIVEYCIKNNYSLDDTRLLDELQELDGWLKYYPILAEKFKFPADFPVFLADKKFVGKSKKEIAEHNNLLLNNKFDLDSPITTNSLSNNAPKPAPKPEQDQAKQTITIFEAYAMGLLTIKPTIKS